jgi:hypothetical protein
VIRRLLLALCLLPAPLLAQEARPELEFVPLDQIENTLPQIEAMPLEEMQDSLPQIEVMPLDEAPGTLQPLETEPQDQAPDATVAPGAVLRGLDRVSGAVTDIELGAGQSADYGSLEITLGECRYPTDNPSSDAYAYLTIRDRRQEGVLFAGWMVASSPALNALDHPRYDVWVMRCIRE